MANMLFGCMHDLRGLPSLVIGDVFVYLTTNCDWTRERLKKFKQDDGFRMYLDKYVEDMEVAKMNDVLNYMYVMAKVKPEQRQTTDRYQTWILCNRHGEVKSAGCGSF